MLAASELAAWLRLLLSDGLGRTNARRLLAAFGSPEAVFEAPPADQRGVVGAAADALAREPDDLRTQCAAVDAWLALGGGRSIITLGDPGYPQALLETADPPLLLFLQGRAELLQAPSVAVVGSRNASPQGLENARAFSAHLSRAGLCVVSGLAAGIDGAAHEGGLTGPGSTVAVVGTGLDRVYPQRHRQLAHRIAAEGLLVSEFPLGTHPLAQNFPMRNRIIAGLSLGTLVVEAAVQSGSLITARLAAEMGREVFAIPGSIHQPQSRGCHALLKQGAKLVESGEDVLEELRFTAPAPAAPDAGGRDTPQHEADPVLEAMGHDPATLDTLIARTGIPAATLNVRLLELELNGQVARLPGALFQRRFAG
ncbi:DNA-processing protein DprA [Ideonella sp. BN130291]|uniref:DNA-processing protein DprA n=1 Tax=Ideonella sp. BN130291 TaxID=3112940 RepID=UPI002E26E449|nr:DNA-processing protein DprA [Ideonella sp. BN130291]